MRFLSILVACLAVLSSIPARAQAPKSTLHFVDAGTGQAVFVFVDGPDFKLLFDGGSGVDDALDDNNRFVAYPKHSFPDLKVIDWVILSHAHKAHVKLLGDVVEKYQVKEVLDSGQVRDICGYRAFLYHVVAVRKKDTVS
jgi:beta-lactamase superfamily II metal-dependent hydrolase